MLANIPKKVIVKTNTAILIRYSPKLATILVFKSAEIAVCIPHFGQVAGMIIPVTEVHSLYIGVDQLPLTQASFPPSGRIICETMSGHHSGYSSGRLLTESAILSKTIYPKKHLNIIPHNKE